MIPNYVIAGFPKCATTYVYELLKQHPEVSVPNIKETRFFGMGRRWIFHNRDGILRTSWEDYQKRFEDKKYRVEFSMSTFDTEAPKIMKDRLGDVKIIFFIRNPNDFIKSMHINCIANGDIRKNLDLNDFKCKYSHTLEFMTNYQAIIDEYRKYFTIVKVFDIDKNGVNKFLEWMSFKDFSFNYDVYHNTSEDLLFQRRPFAFLKRKFLVMGNSNSSHSKEVGEA